MRSGTVRYRSGCGTPNPAEKIPLAKDCLALPLRPPFVFLSSEEPATAIGRPALARVSSASRTCFPAACTTPHRSLPLPPRRRPCPPSPPRPATTATSGHNRACRSTPRSTAAGGVGGGRSDMGDGNLRHVGGGGGSSSSSVVDMYPLSQYCFGSKDAVPEKDSTLADRVQRLRSNYATHGLRTCVEGVILVELFQHPHILLLQVRNSYFKLPGGRLRPGESDIEGLKRKLSSKLSASGSGEDDWQIGECLGMWWRSDFETLPLPFLPSHMRNPKECTKLFLVRLPMNRGFIVPKNLRLLAVPLCQIHDDSETYGPIISGIPQLLSKFSFNMIGT